MQKIFFVFFLISIANVGKAELFLEASLEGGGETFATAERGNDYYSIDDDLNIGGGIKLGIGIQNMIGQEELGSLSVALGYIWDRIDATNGDADFSTITFDVIYTRHFDMHRLGLGASYHIDPRYEEDIDGSTPFDLDFDDSLGFTLKYGYEINQGLQIGVRYTVMEYEINNTDVDADSFGLFLSNGF